MNEDHRPYNQSCPIWRTADVLGDSCTLMILRDLFQDGPRKYSEFHARERGFSLNTLSNRLKELQNKQIITAEQYQVNPVRYQYRLTSQGRKFGPVLKAMYAWGRSD